ncbi:Hsp70 family protein [Micromonospora sp. B11E3]|uniref:Hsp70 family protein n=1 Tax=Micromonospora sp. B11E3 TaxID=3153562 RepID=UPI00325D1027
MAGQHEGYALSVDLGTSNTVAVLRWPDGRTRPLLVDGQPVLPSGVYADADGRLHVGRDARRLAQADPGRYEPNPKRRIDDPVVRLGDREYVPADLLAAILHVVGQAAVAAVGFLPPAVVTCPASWDDARRQVLFDALLRAGWPPAAEHTLSGPTPPGTRLLREPVAAARYYTQVLRRPVPVGGSIAVFDLGGGTLDVAVLRNEGADPWGDSGFTVTAAGGAPDLGGLDLDAALVGRLGELVAGTHPADWQRLDRPADATQWRDRHQLWESVREAREMLSRATVAPVVVPGSQAVVRLTREDLDRVAAPLLRRAVVETRKVVAAAGLAPERLAGLFLVGGPTRMPLVARLLHAELGIAPTVLEQPELPVAEGALTDLPTPRPSATPPPAPAAPIAPAGPGTSPTVPGAAGGVPPTVPGAAAGGVPPTVPGAAGGVPPTVPGTAGQVPPTAPDAAGRVPGAAGGVPPTVPVSPGAGGPPPTRVDGGPGTPPSPTGPAGPPPTAWGPPVSASPISGPPISGSPSPGTPATPPSGARHRRALWITVAAVAALLGIGGGAALWLTRDPYPALEFDLAEVERVPAGDERPTEAFTAVLGDAGYVAYPLPDDRLEIVAVDAETGAQRWRKQTARPAEQWDRIVAVPGGLAVFADAIGSDTPRDLELRDAGSGELRWRWSIGGDDEVIFGRDVAVVVDQAVDRLVGLRMRDGTEAWSRPNPRTESGDGSSTVLRVGSAEGAGGPAYANGAPRDPWRGEADRLVQLGADRSARLIDVTSGSVVRAWTSVADRDDLVAARDDRLYVVDDSGGRYRLLGYDLTRVGEPMVLHTAPDDRRRAEALVACGEHRACLLEVPSGEADRTEVVAATEGDKAKRWRAPGAKELVPVGEHLLALRTYPESASTLFDPDGRAVLADRPGVAVRLDGGNLLVFADPLNGSEADRSVAGVAVDAPKPDELGELMDVRGDSCSWNTDVILCAAQKDFVLYRFAQS